jgi:hypothetical protein
LSLPSFSLIPYMLEAFVSSDRAFRRAKST